MNATDTDLAYRPLPISVPPRAVLGRRADGRPILPIAGGAEDDAGHDNTSGGDAGEGGDGTEGDDDGEPAPDADDDARDGKPKPKPPAEKADPEPGDPDYVPSAAEWRRTQEALKKANRDAVRNRERARELEEQGRTNETEHEKALREAREEGERRYRTPLVQTAARSALVEAGALAFLQDEKDPESTEAREKGESRLKRLLKLVDTEALDLDDDGSVLGLVAAVDDLRRDYPELFAAPARKTKARPTGAPRPAVAEKPKTTAEIHAARLLGKA